MEGRGESVQNREKPSLTKEGFFEIVTRLTAFKLS